MIPEPRKLRTLCRKAGIREVPSGNYFAIAEEFTTLVEEFASEDRIQQINVWIDMILYPLYLLYTVFTGSWSWMSIFSIQKSVQIWIRWWRFRTLKQEMRTWIEVVRSVGGPFISCNDSTYHMFVYADGMERIRRALSLPKKLRKRAK